MEYRDGLPHLRVNIGGDNITITGSVNVGTEIRVNNTEEQSIPVHLTDDPIAVTQSTSPWVISRNSTANGTGNRIYVSTDGTVSLSDATLTALENINATVTGTVALDSATLTALETISVNATQVGTWTVGLSQASLDALENTTVTISGTPNVNIGTNGTVSLSDATLTALETITVNQGTAGASAWKVDIGNNGTVTANVTFPSIYKISRNASDNATGNPIYVNFTNSTIGVTGTFWQETQPVSLTTLPDSNVTLKTGSAVIGKVDQNGTWTVGISAGSNVIGKVDQNGTWTVGLNSGTNTIGKVDLNTGTNSIGTVGLNSGSNTIGKVDQASTSNPWIISKNSTVNSSDNPINVNFTNTSIGTTFTNTSIGVTQGTNPWTVNGTVTLDTTIPPLISYADTVQMDTVDRLRTSVIGQQWWYVPSIDKDGDLRIQEAFQGTGASSTYIQNLASVRLTSGQTYNSDKTLTGSAIRASRRRHKTRPGVSTEWIGIVNWDGLQANVVKRIGMFTSFNGVFIEARSDGIYAVVRRRLTDGTLVETAKKHTEWSLDQMDGAGPSKYNWQLPNVVANVTSVYAKNTVAISGDGNVYQVVYQMPSGQESIIPVGKKVTLTGLTPATFNDTGLVTAIDTVNHRVTVAYVVDPGSYVSASSAKMTNTEFHAIHSYWFDMNGSRIGRVRFGMYTDHGKVCVHEYTSGEIGTQVFSAPALMDRKEIVNVGQPVDFLPSMTVAGSAVTIETSSEINPGFGIARTATAITFNKNSQVGSEFAILGVGLRIGEPYQRADLQVNKLQIVDLGNLNPQNAGIFQYRLVLNPTVTGTVTTTNVGKASRQLTYAQGSTATGGIELIAGYAQGTWTGDVGTALNFLNMGSNIAYTDSDVVVLLIKLLVGGTDNSSVMGTINYTEDL